MCQESIGIYSLSSSQRDMLNNFFIWGAVPLNAHMGEYAPVLIVLSYIVASIGSFTGIHLASSMAVASDRVVKNILQVCGAFSLGCGIWSMHFIGMLSYKMDMPVGYDPLLTFVSMLIAVVIAFCVFHMTRFKPFSLKILVVASILLGFAICSLHYVGMAAMGMDAKILYKPWLFLVSIGIAIAASAGALWIIFYLAEQTHKYKFLFEIIGALVMGAAICGMHYTGMAAAVFVPTPEHYQNLYADSDALMLTVLVVAAVIFAGSLIFSFVFNERAVVDKQQDYPFPTKLLVFSLLLTFLAIVWASGSSVYVNRRMTEDIQTGLEISNKGSRVAYLDTVISRSLRLAVTTSDPKWEQAYNENLQLLDEIIRNIEAISSSHAVGYGDDYTSVQSLALRLDRNTDFFLTALENKTFDLVHEGKRDEAKALLDGTEYADRKQDYSNDVEKLAEDTSAILNHTLKSLARTIFYTLYAGGVVIIILPISWYFAFRSIRHWRRELETTRKNLLDNEKQLQSFIFNVEISRAEAVEAKIAAEKVAKTVALLRSVSSTANKVSDINTAIQSILNLICDYIDCPIGHAYSLDAEHQILRSLGLWSLHHKEALSDFVNISDIMPLKRGEDLPGRVWDAKTPLWIENLSKDMHFPRMELQPDLPLKTGFAFPLLVDGDVAYVFEFYFTETKEIDLDFLTILEEISGQLIHVIQRNHSEESMRQAKEMAEKASATKSDFLANMSHELRTPLNSILGMLRLLKESNLDEEAVQLADAASRSSVNLLEIVNDILDISKIEAGEMKLERIGMDINYALHSIIELMNTVAKEKKISLLLQEESVTFPYVLGDPVRFIRILTNLVGNALKYTQQGQVTVRATALKLDDRHIEFSCEVIDTGIGIAKEALQKVFEKFIQADSTTTRRFGGTGLGLTITKELVQLMGGMIGVESEVGVGSNFWFTIPFEITEKLSQEKNRGQRKTLSGIIRPEKARVLVAEDNVMNQMLLERLFKKFGIEIYHVVSTGVEALKCYQAESWDIILMDCHMPEMNGYDTTIAIRKIEHETGFHVPIIAMTANAMISDREKCLRVGMDDYISKPIGFDEMKSVLGQWLRFGGDDVMEPVQEQVLNDESHVHIDLTLLNSNTDGDVAFQKVLVQALVEQGDEDLSVFYENPIKFDMPKWKEIAHRLKGGAAHLGAIKLSNLCKEGQHFKGTEQELAEFFKTIIQEYENVKKQLRNVDLL